MLTIWVVGKRESTIARWFLNGAEVSTGTATVKFIRDTAGTIEYLQSDLSTWSSTSASHSLTFAAGVGWRISFAIPTSADGYTVHSVATHSNGSLSPLAEEHYVTTYDVDDAVNAANQSTISVREV